jgi:hypothetical protein
VNESPNVRVGRRTAQTMLHVDGMSTEVGTHQRKLFIESLLIEYNADRGHWRWETVTAFGVFGDGKPGNKAWIRDSSSDIPEWAVILIYTHVPQYREVAR